MAGPLTVLRRTPGEVAARVRSMLRDKARTWQMPEQFFDPRVDRLYDEAPLSFAAYRAEALARAFAEADRTDSEQLAALTPKTFLELAAPLPPSEWSDRKVGALRSLLRGEEPRPEDYANLDSMGWYAENYPVWEGAADVPFLNVRPNPRRSAEDPDLRVWGHEGRHRARAALDAWGDVPLAVRLRAYDRPTWDVLARAPALLSERSSLGEMDEWYPPHPVPLPASRYAAFMLPVPLLGGEDEPAPGPRPAPAVRWEVRNPQPAHLPKPPLWIGPPTPRRSFAQTGPRG